MDCPVCGTALTRRLHEKVPDFEHGLPVSVDFAGCPSCGLVAQVPAPPASALAGYYPKDYRAHAAAAGKRGLLSRLKDIQASGQASRIAAFLPEKSEPILEVGSGGGNFLHALRRRGFTDLTAIDRAPELGRVFEASGIRYRAQDLDRDPDLGGPYAAILMNYVIEHFADPATVLRACKAALKPGGRLILLTPNPASLSHRVFGRFWSGLHAPRHTQLFTPRSLKLLADKTGFGGVEFVYATDPGSWTLSFQNLIASRRSGAPAAGTAWYSLLLLPAWYPFALVERALGRGAAMFGILS